MRKNDIEKSLKKAADGFTPDVLDRVMAASGSTVTERPAKRQNKKLYFKIAAVAAACLIVLSAGGWFFGGYMTEGTETVYLEVNPAVELTTTRYNTVKEISFENAEAEALFASYDAVGKSVDEVVETYVGLCIDEGYLSETNSDIIISDLSKKDAKADKTLNRLNKIAQKKCKERNITATVTNQKVNRTVVDQAKAERIPVGKMKIINDIIALDATYTVDGLRDKTVKELKAIYADCLAVSETEETSNNGNGGGNGNGNK